MNNHNVCNNCEINLCRSCQKHHGWVLRYTRWVRKKQDVSNVNTPHWLCALSTDNNLFMSQRGSAIRRSKCVPTTKKKRPFSAKPRFQKRPWSLAKPHAPVLCNTGLRTAVVRSTQNAPTTLHSIVHNPSRGLDLLLSHFSRHLHQMEHKVIQHAVQARGVCLLSWTS